MECNKKITAIMAEVKKANEAKWVRKDNPSVVFGKLKSAFEEAVIFVMKHGVQAQENEMRRSELINLVFKEASRRKSNS